MKIKVYMPREDSRLLEKEVLNFAQGSVLDMGTGSGIQAEAAASLRKVKKVLAVDKSRHALDFCKEHLKSRKIKLLKSDLFLKVPEQRFDTIIFNPPYLPSDKVEDAALDGGKRGYELLEEFLDRVGDYLKPKGVLLIVFSSLTNKDKINEILRKNFLDFELLNTAHFFYEKLYTYKITKSDMLKEFERKKISHIHYLAKGKRGLVFTGLLRKKKIAIKVKNPESKAQHSIENEARILKMLNKKKIGPKFVAKGKNYLIYYFVSGDYIKDWLPKANKKSIKRILKDVLKQCNTLDKLKINKLEMHHPIKHIIISHSPVMIDFERAYKTRSPKNVTQFLQFVRANERLLNQKGFNITKEKILDISKKYSKDHVIGYVIRELGL